MASDSSSKAQSSSVSNSEAFTIGSFYSSTPTQFPCLYTRMLHEQCGHVSTLTIHEAPCSRPYFGWVLSPPGSSSAPIAPPRISCEGMKTHIAIDRSKCKTCKEDVPAPAPVAAKTWKSKFTTGWGKDKKTQVAVVKKGRDRESVDIGEIVKRRAEWKREIEARKVRKEQKTLESMKEKDCPWT